MDDQGCVPNTVMQVYTNDAGGTKPYSTGVLLTNDPTQPYQCANKKYVDDTIEEKTLYRHNIMVRFSTSGFGGQVRFQYHSPNNLKCTSLADLKTLMGDNFQQPATGYTSTALSVWLMTATTIEAGTGSYLLSDFTLAIDDDVKKVI